MDILHVIACLVVALMLFSPVGVMAGGWWWFTSGRTRFPMVQWAGFTLLCGLLAVACVIAELVLGLYVMGVGQVFLVGATVGLFGLAIRQALPVEGGRRRLLASLGLLAMGVLVFLVSASLAAGIGMGTTFQIQERGPGQACLMSGEREDIGFVLQALLCLSVAFIADMGARKRVRAALGGCVVIAALGVATMVMSGYPACGALDVSSMTAGYSAEFILGNGANK